MAEFQKAANLSSIKEGEVKGVKINSEEIALYRLGKDIFATANICTHEQCIISDDYLIDGQEVECNCHGSHFNIKTGKNTVPPAAEPLKTYKVKVEGDEVLIEV
ncbi:MAG: non-heme iron oxygenase ferredoxin subunit [Candidatus Woykebacteria bacterium]